MSFRELSITIAAENLASAEFNRVSADAARMGEGARASAAGFNELTGASRETAAGMSEMGSQAHEAASGMEDLKTKAESTTVSIRTVATTLTTFAGLSTAVISLAGDLGIVDKESAKWARTMLSIITITSTWIRLKSYLTTITAGHTAATALNTTAQSANASASIASAVAHKIYASAAAFATMVQNSLNISYATFLALTGVGIAVIVAAAVAMWSFANSMNAATSSVQSFNEAAVETPTRTRGIQRAGEEEMYRRGVE